MKKSIVLLAVAALLSFRKAEAPAASVTSSTQPAAKTMKVGLLTPGSVNDNGWNAIAYEGLQRIRKELGAEISHQETKTPAEFEEGFRSWQAWNTPRPASFA